MSTARNVGILLAIAALIAFLPGGGNVASVASRTLSLAFIAVVVFAVAWAYRNKRIDIEPLTPALRALLYSSIGLFVLTFAAWSRLSPTSGGMLFAIGLLAAGGGGLYYVWREYHQLA